MVAAYEYERMNVQHHLPWREKVRFPSRPVVAEHRTADLRFRTFALTIVIVAEMNGEIGFGGGDGLGNGCERPSHRIGAGLDRFAGFETAAGVADNHDLLRAGWRQGQPSPAETYACNDASVGDELADRVREPGARRGAHGHRLRRTVDRQRWTGGVIDDCAKALRFSTDKLRPVIKHLGLGRSD